MPPVYSDDLLRYRWEGRLQARGGNPYAVRPVDRPELLREEDHRLPGRDFKAIYGPLVLLTERVAYAVSGENLLLLRWPFALADLLTLALLAWRFGLKAWVLYGWCPLAAFEFWSGGHNDSLCLLAVATAMWAFDQGRGGAEPEAKDSASRPSDPGASNGGLSGWWVSGWSAAGWVALGCAVLTKWWPAMLIPFFLRGHWRKAAWAGLPAALLAPLYWTDFRENAQFSSGFVGGWRNNDSLFGGLLWLTGDLYRAKYLAFGLMAAWALLLSLPRPMPAKASLKQTSLAQTSLWAVTGLLLLAANVHPWYLTWLLPFLLSGSPQWYALVWIALAPVAFEPAIVWRNTGVWNGLVPSRWGLYLPMFATLVFTVLERWYHRGRKETLS